MDPDIAEFSRTTSFGQVVDREIETGEEILPRRFDNLDRVACDDYRRRFCFLNVKLLQSRCRQHARIIYIRCASGTLHHDCLPAGGVGRLVTREETENEDIMHPILTDGERTGRNHKRAIRIQMRYSSGDTS